jgi:hypothetical protein
MLPAAEGAEAAVPELGSAIPAVKAATQAAAVAERLASESAIAAVEVAVEANRRPIRIAHRGVTLLELILALALSVVILTAVGMAINLYFKMLDVRRTSVEEMQVVRIVTQRMSNDIRTIVQPNEPDLSGLQTAFQNAMQAASKQASAAAAGSTTTIIGGGSAGSSGVGGGAGGANGGNQGGGQAGGQAGKAGQAGGGQAPGQAAGKTGGATQGNQSAGAQGSKTGGAQAAGGGAASGGSSGAGTSGSGSTAAQSGATSTTAGSTTATAVVKLTGTATELQFDISRIPRVDQYKGIVSSNGELSPVDLPSDVKTIAYYLRSEASAESFNDDPHAPGGDASTDGYGRGLMRAEMDRAVTSYADSSGGTASIYSTAQLLADEVVGLGFEYFDGTEWPTEWDSSSQGLPRAIRVWLSVKPRYGMSEKEIADANAGKEPKSTDFYFIITLPTSPLVATPPTTETTDSSSGTSSATSAGTGTTP